MKKLIVSLGVSLTMALPLSALFAPAAHAIPDKISGGVCTAWGGSVVTDAVGKNYCSGGAFDGFDVID